MVMRAINILSLAHIDKDALAVAHIRSVSRPKNAGALGIDFYQADHAARPLEKARFCICRYEWRGSRWHRVFKLTGPRKLDQILGDLQSMAARTGLPIIDQA